MNKYSKLYLSLSPTFNLQRFQTINQSS